MTRWWASRVPILLLVARLCCCCQFALENDLAATLDVRAWRENSMRIRLPLGSSSAVRDDLPGAIIPAPAYMGQQLECDHRPGGGSDNANQLGSVINGNLKADVSSDGLLTFTRLSDNKVVLRETSRKLSPGAGGATSVVQTFASSEKEMIFGFGEHQNGHLNQKGLNYDFEQCLEYGHSHGGEVCLPFILGYTPTESSAQETEQTRDRAEAATMGPCLDYGLLWNMPGYGSVSFEGNTTTWTAIAALQLDMFVTVAAAGSSGMACNADINARYVDATGHSPVLPEWAAGYWHSKNRYSSQKDLLAAATIFHERAIPVDVIVIDYHHWKTMGDWSFDPAAWPDPQSMADTIQTKFGMRIMVSVWPFSMTKSSSFPTINASGYGVQKGSDGGELFWPDPNCGGPCYLYDPTQSASREYVWSRLQAGYLKYGIHVFWLDASEPENIHGVPDGAHYKAGPSEQVGMMFPFYHSRTIHDGQVSQAQPPIMLLRSGWAGQQRYGGAVWSGDTQSNFGSLERSIRAGLNIQLSGIAWWTTDIGGYSGGNPNDPQFNELIVRWFQFGATCPLFRQHGARSTEPWLLSNQSYALVVKVIEMRAQWKSYVLDAMQQVNTTGLPVQRPLWYDFPGDPHTWAVEDQYMFGSSLMAAPVYTYQARNRTVYFPSGSKWQHYFTSIVYDGGASRTIDAPLDNFPLFKRMNGTAWASPVEVR
ncbi:uncharacterized family 31 glucosidase ORF2-like [Sycon ciliatum]|uniref:uncharacterized family 31 glucosidase ORF2-like n=1 Tax=Sycon ciliatum TaxID=27933 RepID=UPI0020AD3B1C|eukprot:scpid48973/ scgid8676/ Uncharacterized family 31 glucosidase ORF2